MILSVDSDKDNHAAGGVRRSGDGGGGVVGVGAGGGERGRHTVTRQTSHMTANTCLLLVPENG